MMKSLKKTIFKGYSKFSKIIHEVWAVFFPVWYAKYYYRLAMSKKLNLRNPRDYNEKVQWLKVYSDTSQWTELADKFKVREYISKCGLNHILVELYGVWKKAEDIDFTMLPEKFVLKTNNGCGTNILVFDKAKLDIDQTRKTLNRWMKERNGLVDFQPHMWNIERRIIAEEYLQETLNTSFSSSLVDYKFWCLNGAPAIIMVLYDRKNVSGNSSPTSDSPPMRANVYDLEWNLRQDIISGTLANYKPAAIPKPKCFNEMLEISRILSKPFPQVRVDLYEVNGKVYFGELTFTPGGGMKYFTQAYFLKMGEMLDLSNVKRRRKLFIV